MHDPFTTTTLTLADRIRMLRSEVDLLSVEQIRGRLEMLAKEAEEDAADLAACAEGHPI